MTITEQIIEKVQALSPGDQQKILDILAALPSAQEQENARKPTDGLPMAPPKTLLGRFSHRGVHLSAEDVSEIRREMWANFPRVAPGSKRDGAW
jgi:hypothetical protein